MKKNKIKRKKLIWVNIGTTILVIAIVGLLIYGMTSLVSGIKPFYEIKERTNKINNYNKTHEETNAVGWIRVQGTNIDYPVIYASSSVDVSKITEDFTWVLDNVDELTNYTYILGHNIRNVSSNPLITDKSHTRFEQLPSFLYLDFAEKNKYIQYSIDGKDYLFKIFSTSFVKHTDQKTETENMKQEELKEYINKSLKDSYFDFDVDVDENDKIITLATCTRFYGPTTEYMYKIDARLVRDNEKIKNYKVEENDNYKAIKKIMKVGDEDDKEEL